MYLSRTIALLIFCTSLSLSTLLAEPVEATVTSVTGTVQYAPPGSQQFSPLMKDMKVPSGTTIRSMANSEAVLRVTPGSAIRVAPETVLVLSDMEFQPSDTPGGKPKKRKAKIQLSEGTVSALLKHDIPEQNDFKITTSQGTVAARGTFFAVMADKNGETFVKVQEGQVGYQKPKPEEIQPPEGKAP